MVEVAFLLGKRGKKGNGTQGTDPFQVEWFNPKVALQDFSLDLPPSNRDSLLKIN